jgi:hypothetical protein
MAMTNLDDAELEAQFQAEFDALYARMERFHLDLSPLDAWVLLSQIQLALRHPGNQGESARIARGIAKRLQCIVAPHGALAIIAERGWDSNYDVPVEEPPHDSA